MSDRRFRVRCVYCKYPNHFKGIVVKYSSGSRTLVGRDCALSHHGVEFQEKLVDFDAGVEYQDLIRRKNKLLSVRAQLQQEFENLKVHPAVRLYDQVYGQWRSGFSVLARKITSIVRAGEIFTINREVRDEAAERERKQRLGNRFEEERQRVKAAGGSWQLTKHVSEVLGTVQGPSFFVGSTTVGQKIQGIQGQVQRQCRILSGEDLLPRQISAALKELGDLRRNLFEEFERLEALPQAFAPENLARIARWANEQAPITVVRRESIEDELAASYFPAKLAADGMSITDKRWRSTASVPVGYRIPKRDLLDLMTKAISSDSTVS